MEAEAPSNAPAPDETSTHTARSDFGTQFRSLDAAAAPDELLAFLDGVARLPAFREMKRDATAALQLGPGDRVLEVGCGTGVDLCDLATAVSPGGTVIGIDSSTRAVEVAAARSSRCESVAVQVADAHDLPFDDGSFDAVRIDRVLLHLARPDQALSEVRRVLRSGGRLVIVEAGSTLDGDSAVINDPVRCGFSDALWQPGEQAARIDFFLPLLLARSGFDELNMERGEIVSNDFADACTMLRLTPPLGAGAERGQTADARVSAWLSDLESAMTSGSVVLKIGFVRFDARAA